MRFQEISRVLPESPRSNDTHVLKSSLRQARPGVFTLCTIAAEHFCCLSEQSTNKGRKWTLIGRSRRDLVFIKVQTGADGRALYRFPAPGPGPLSRRRRRARGFDMICLAAKCNGAPACQGREATRKRPDGIRRRSHVTTFHIFGCD